ncbi:MAG TPA: HD domain-containing phosphohydrolase [Anaerolineales bacterium]|nr:HD domain-containing phosphohydrolase [Anaerolineales bacterium]
MPLSSSRKIHLIIAGILSLLAQGILLTPTRLEVVLQYIPRWGSIAFGAALFVISLLSFLNVMRSITIKGTLGWRANESLLAIQILTVIGLILILERAASPRREAGFLLSSVITVLTTYGIFQNASSAESRSGQRTEKEQLRSILMPDPSTNINALNEQITSLTHQLAAEKRRTTQLTLLNELSQQLEAELDPPVAAQLAVNTLERAMDCSIVALMMSEPENQGYVVLAAAGNMTSIIPPGYRRDAGKGVIGRTARLKKTQIVNDVRLDPDFIPIQNEATLSLISVPVIQHGHVKGVLVLCSEKPHMFTGPDAAITEGVASELMRAWDRASYHQRLTELIQAGISLTTLLDPQAAVLEIAVIARKTLEARFVFVTLLDQQGNFSRTAFAGDAPLLLSSLDEKLSEEPLMQAALNATKPFRVRDLRKYVSSNKLEIDHAGLRSVLAIPIRLHRLSIGTILAFGKQEEIFFSENDESLADLLASQAAASIESSWLYQELRNTLNITSMLYQLSVDVIQAEELSNAAMLIAQVAHKVTNAKETGIVLLTRDGQIQAEVEIDASGLHRRREHPAQIIDQAIETGQSIIVSVESGSLVCYPLLTRGRTYGALWMKMPESRGQNFANLQTLANQAAIALERSILLLESRQQAKQLEAAYEELEITYDRTLTALMSALDARDRETEGHSMRVSRLACLLGEKIGLTGQQLKALERGALLHDIGKIGISDTILHKTGSLTTDEWKIMRVHPDIGARIVEGIPFLQETLPVIRYHHERWDGSGYPLGLIKKEIPTQARIFAVVDVFDALTSSRSYRKKSSPEEALQYLREQANILFDPEIVEALADLPYREFIEGEKTIA